MLSSLCQLPPFFSVLCNHSSFIFRPFLFIFLFCNLFFGILYSLFPGSFYLLIYVLYLLFVVLCPMFSVLCPSISIACLLFYFYLLYCYFILLLVFYVSTVFDPLSFVYCSLFSVIYHSYQSSVFCFFSLYSLFCFLSFIF